MCPFFWKQSTRCCDNLKKRVVENEPPTLNTLHGQKYSAIKWNDRRRHSKECITKCSFYFHCCINISSKWSHCCVSLARLNFVALCALISKRKMLLYRDLFHQHWWSIIKNSQVHRLGKKQMIQSIDDKCERFCSLQQLLPYGCDEWKIGIDRTSLWAFYRNSFLRVWVQIEKSR